MDDQGTQLDQNGDKIVRRLAEVTDRIKRIGQRANQRGEDKESIERLESEVVKLSGEMSRWQQERKGARETDDAGRMLHDSGRRGGPLASLKAAAASRRYKADPEVAAVQSFMDDAYILQHVLGKEELMESDWLQEKADEIPMLQKALQTGGSTEPNWLPVAFSPQLHERVRLQLKVAALHNRIDMPTTPYKLPIEGTPAQHYLVAEATGNDQDVTGSPPGADRTVPANMATPKLGNLTLTAAKLGTRVLFSAEVNEQSIIPILEYVRGQIELGMANAEEDTTINGDTAGSHMDTDVTASNDSRKAWDGYRKHAPSTCKVAVTTPGSIDVVTDLRKLRTRLGKYAIMPGQCPIVAGVKSYTQLLSLKDGSNPSPVMTLEKYGPQASLLTGELARVDGQPIIVSEFVREDLGTGGVYTGGTVDRTMFLMVNRQSFVYGDYRPISIKSREIIETDQMALVLMRRMTFNNWFGAQANQPLGAQTVVGYLYNLQ